MFFAQLLVVVWDSGNPEMEVSTTVTLTVRRNEYPPTFFPLRYSASVSEHDPVGTNITRVTASDSDLPVSFVKFLRISIQESCDLCHC